MTAPIRPALGDDLAAVATLLIVSRQSTYRGIIADELLEAMDPVHERDVWADLVDRQSATHRMFVAEADARVIGFSYVGSADDEEDIPPGGGVLNAIHVHPDARGTGVGRALMRRLLRALADRGIRRAVLWVLESNAHARRFYERGGWVADGAVRDALVGSAVTRQMRYARVIGATSATES